MAINSLSSASNGFAGLASGIDTETMVDQLLSGTQNKIDSTNQKITQLEYKQELYREVISDLQSFQSTYFDILNPASCLMTSTLFKDMSATTTSSAYSVTASSSSVSGSVTVDSITSLATKYKQTAKNTASSAVSGAIDSDAINAWKDKMTNEEKLSFTIGDNPAVEVKASDLVGKSSLEVESILNTALEGTGAKVQFLSGKFTISTGEESTTKVTISATDGLKAMLGGQSEISGEGSLTTEIDANSALPTIQVTLDGVTKDISFNPFDSDSIASQLNSALNNAFGSGISVAENGGKLTFVTGASRKISVDGENLSLLGLKSGASNKISLGSSLKNNSFATAIEGDYQKFSINGVDFAFSSDATLSEIMNAINNSDAGVNISYSSTTDKFSLEAKETGVRTEGFEISTTEGNLMEAMFGVKNYSTSSTTVNSQGLTLADGSNATVDSTLAEVGMTDGLKITVGNEEMEFDASQSLKDVIAAVNSKASAIAGSEVTTLKFVEDSTPPYISICGVPIPIQIVDTRGALTGGTELNVGAFDITEGTNAKMKINGVEVERATNSFTVDGLSFTLNSTTDQASHVSVSQNTDKIYETIVKFANDYNELVNKINGLLDADATYREYAPLTSAQEEEMTESQIEKWNKKAKEGLLRNDSTLTSVLSSLRSTLYTKPEGALALYDLGITTSYFGTKDNLTIADPDKLKTLISENPDKVMKLFTDSNNGLAVMLDKAIDKAAKASSGDPGSLVRMAGSTGKSDTDSSIYKQIKELKSQVSKLEDRYDKEYNRYWSQFNAMEQMISDMNSQSSWLSSMMA